MRGMSPVMVYWDALATVATNGGAKSVINATPDSTRPKIARSVLTILQVFFPIVLGDAMLEQIVRGTQRMLAEISLKVATAIAQRDGRRDAVTCVQLGSMLAPTVELAIVVSEDFLFADGLAPPSLIATIIVLRFRGCMVETIGAIARAEIFGSHRIAKFAPVGSTSQ